MKSEKLFFFPYLLKAMAAKKHNKNKTKADHEYAMPTHVSFTFIPPIQKGTAKRSNPKTSQNFTNVVPRNLLPEFIQKSSAPLHTVTYIYIYIYIHVTWTDL